ncbi:DUF397 domain-containing protein [Actinomadura bangladeshensis]
MPATCIVVAPLRGRSIPSRSAGHETTSNARSSSAVSGNENAITLANLRERKGWGRARSPDARPAGAQNGGDCVELASASDLISVRDSKHFGEPVVAMKRGGFRRLAEVLKSV